MPVSSFCSELQVSSSWMSLFAGLLDDWPRGGIGCVTWECGRKMVEFEAPELGQAEGGREALDQLRRLEMCGEA